MRSISYFVAVAIIVALSLAAGQASSAPAHVNCDAGQSLQQAFDRAPAADGRLFEVSVTGTCRENLRIGRQQFRITGDEGATISGRVRVLAGTRGSLADLSVYGRVVVFGANLTLSNVDISGPGPGLLQSDGRTRLLGVRIHENSGPGLQLSGNGITFFASGSVEFNGGDGVVIEDASIEIGEVSIFGNENGINALMSKAALGDNTNIFDNRIHGVDGNFHSSILVRDGVQIYNNSGSGVRLEMDSGLAVFGTVSMHDNNGGNVFCVDTESSVQFFDNIPAEVYCTDFNQVAPAF